MRRPVLVALFAAVMAAGFAARPGGHDAAEAQPAGGSATEEVVSGATDGAAGGVTGDAAGGVTGGGISIGSGSPAPAGLGKSPFGDRQGIAFPPRVVQPGPPPSIWERIKRFFAKYPLLILLVLSFLGALIKRNEDAWGFLAVGAIIAAAVWGGARVIEWATSAGWVGSRSFAITGTLLLIGVAIALHRLHVHSPRLFAFTEIAFGSVGLYYGLRNVGSPGGWAAVAVGVYGLVEGIDRSRQTRSQARGKPDAKPDVEPEPATQTPQVL